MANVSRASTVKANINRLRYHKVKVFLQRYPGKFGSDAERGIDKTPDFTVYIDGSFSQAGQLEADGSVEVLIPSGSIAVVKTLGTEYEIEPIQRLEDSTTLLGVQRRLQLLGYLSADVDDKWDAATDRAVLNFQADHGLDPNGAALDTSTVNKLKSELGE